MRIEVLYIPGCPNYQPTVEQVQRVLKSQSLSDQVYAISVNTAAEAESLDFPGSPTVRVNGRDIEPNRAVVPGLTCRLYAHGNGVPPEDIVRAAISGAKQKE